MMKILINVSKIGLDMTIGKKFGFEIQSNSERIHTLVPINGLFVFSWTNLKCVKLTVNQQGIFSNDYMCIYCGGQVKKDNTIDLECSNDVLNGTTEDEITDWLKNTKNVGATDFCFNGTHTDLVMSSCFCPPGESFRKVRSTLSPLRPDIFICRFCVILNRR